MRYALAPMEGVTGHVFRQAHAACFGPADKYLTPFLSPNQNLCFTSRERAEVLPEHNDGLNVVPQLLTSNAAHFLWASRELAAMGYREVNLNLGCPSGTVSAKGKGAGFLAYPDRLERFLDQVFSYVTIDVSVKTRIGKAGADEWDSLLELFNRYPICELTVHPRVQADFYQGRPNRRAFRKAVGASTAPLCYNGDLFSLPDLEGMEVYQNSPSILMPSRHPLALADRLEVPQLKDEQFVVLSQDECGASVYTLVDLCGKDGFYPKISRYVDSNADRVSLGYGISIIDLEFPIPSWAGLVTVPLYSRANGVFQGIHVRMVWSRSGTNPSIRLLAALARQLIQNKEEARL